MRRKIVTLAVVALFAGCGFPSIEYGSGDGGPGGLEASVDGAPRADGSSGGEGATGDDEGGSDGAGSSSGGDASSGSDSTADGPHDAVADVGFEAAPDANPCDQDNDHYDSVACGGKDCCDTDPRANPGDTQYWDVADNCGSYDYNCNGMEDLEYTQDLSCSGLSVTGCSGTGFTGSPGCGGQGPYGSCTVSGLKCTVGPVANETQYCR